MQRTAVADLGSNSFRLVVFSAQDGWWKRTDEIYEAVRIGAGLAQTGELSRERMERAWSVVEVFDHFCRATGIDDVITVATSAIRDARNGPEFVAHALLPVRVLSREEEARYGYLAAINSSTLQHGAVLDLGGGSMQLVAVRRPPRRRPGVLAAGRGADDRALRRRHRRPARARHPGRRRDAVGEGPRATGSSASAAPCATWPPRRPPPRSCPASACRASTSRAEALDGPDRRLAALPAGERGKVDGIKPARADIILAGAVVVHAVLEAGGFDGVEVTEAGLREGIFFERHLAPADADTRCSPTCGAPASRTWPPSTASTPPTPSTSPS